MKKVSRQKEPLYSKEEIEQLCLNDPTETELRQMIAFVVEDKDLYSADDFSQISLLLKALYYG